MKAVKTLSALAALFMLMPAFTSCDKDDDDEPVEADPIAGTYSGTMTCDVAAMGQNWSDLPIDGEKGIKIIKNDKNPGRVTVVIPECSYKMPLGQQSLQTIPSLTVENVEVEDLGNGSYSLDIDDCIVPVDGVQYTVSIEDYDKDDQKGTVISKDKINLVYSVVPGLMPGVITFYFDGNRK